jgi:formylglycine-generating enzyme required for sulfatase activity
MTGVFFGLRPCANRPSAVGTHPLGASPFGVEDMIGNVEEWTADWYADRAGVSASSTVGTAHVLRGGGWMSTQAMSYATARDWASSMEAGPNVGFRCARDNDAPGSEP